jgi:DNA-binding MarR family transcriptional regulator
MRKGNYHKMGNNDSKKDDSLIESYRLFSLLRQTADSVLKAREAELKKYNISPEQAAALVCIRSLDNKATPAELSRWLFRKRNSITILLNRMHKLGLISKNINKDRKNSITIRLTKKGYDAYQKSIEFLAFRSIIEVLPEGKRKQLWQLLQTIRLKVFKDLLLDIEAHSGFFNKPLKIYPDTLNTGRIKPKQKDL